MAISSIPEFVELGNDFGSAIEDPQRLVIQRREHHEVAAVFGRDDAAVNERNVDAGCGVVQQARVVVGAAGQPLLDRHAFAREDLPCSVARTRGTCRP